MSKKKTKTVEDCRSTTFSEFVNWGEDHSIYRTIEQKGQCWGESTEHGLWRKNLPKERLQRNNIV
jgi:hypothetical protein